MWACMHSRPFDWGTYKSPRFERKASREVVKSHNVGCLFFHPQNFSVAQMAPMLLCMLRNMMVPQAQLNEFIRIACSKWPPFKPLFKCRSPSESHIRESCAQWMPSSLDCQKLLCEIPKARILAQLYIRSTSLETGSELKKDSAAIFVSSNWFTDSAKAQHG